MKAKIKISAVILSAVLGAGLASGCSAGRGEEFIMRAQITEKVAEELLVEVIEAPHGNTGPFFVIISDDTPTFNSQGDKIPLGELAVGDVIEITYGGQVMMSYPPKIAARKIVVAPKAQ